MKLNVLGIVFKYHGDEILRYWPWSKRDSKSSYHSTLYSRDFNSFNEYWRMVGEETSLVKSSFGKGNLLGFDLIDVLKFWSARMWVGEPIVVLMAVDPSLKGPSFWARLTSAQRENLLKDIVVLKCTDKSEMKTLVDSIDPSFAEATGLLNGRVILTNDPYEPYEVYYVIEQPLKESV